MTEFVSSELYPDIKLTPAMLISKQPSKDKFDNYLKSGKYLGQIKKDGAWYQLLKQNGEVYLFGRSLSKVTGFYLNKIENVPHIKEWAQLLPDNTTLIGEIYYPGGHSNDATKIMGCKAATAIQRQKSGEYPLIHYYIHDIVQYNNIDLYDLPAQERMKNYLSLLESLATNEVEIATVFYDNLENELENAFSNGEEGMVFKHKEEGYQGGKRPTYNFKAKTEVTFDAVIIGFISPEKYYTGKEAESWPYLELYDDGELYYVEGGGRYIKGPTRPVTKAYFYGWKAGINIGAFDNDGVLHSVGTISSGLTDFMRQDLAENSDNYLNQVVEIQAMSVDKKNHSIRHGRFIKMRPDKNPEDCILEEIFN